MPSFKIIGFWGFFEVFTIYGRGGHLLSRDLDHLYRIPPFSWRLRTKFGFDFNDWPSDFGGVFENGGRKTDRHRSISSPCEPDGSGELKCKGLAPFRSFICSLQFALVKILNRFSYITSVA